MGASLWVTVCIFCGTPSSQILKCSLATFGGSASGRPSFITTRASTVTTGTSTRSEYSGMSSCFLGLGGGGVSSPDSLVLFGTAIGPTSPPGPPASGGAWSGFCDDCVFDEDDPFVVCAVANIAEVRQKTNASASTTDGRRECFERCWLLPIRSVSYTHLTLPTKR